MQITHDEARRLIQFDADQALKTEQKTLLRFHLKECLDCQEYANSLGSMTSMLSSAMQKNWNKPHSPLPIAVLLPKRNARNSASIILATRIVAVTVMAIAFLFSVRQVTGPIAGGSGTLAVNAPPNPTPSAQSTSTQILLQNCTQVFYIVRQDDTLDTLAGQFSVTKEELMAANEIDDELLVAGMELVIESCTAPPTGTFHATGTLFTPLTSPTVATPGG